MSYRQIQVCTERLMRVAPAAADDFEELMVLADRYARRAADLRREGWAIYHQWFQPKRPRE